MSGIVCVYSEAGIAQDAPRYLAALRRLHHRGRDGEGSLLDRIFSSGCEPLMWVQGR